MRLFIATSGIVLILVIVWAALSRNKKNEFRNSLIVFICLMALMALSVFAYDEIDKELTKPKDHYHYPSK